MPEKGRPTPKVAKRKKKQNILRAVEEFVLPKKKKAKSSSAKGFPAIWSVKEKRNLLEALKRHGPTNIGRIANFIETKTPEEVKKKIHTIKNQPRIKNYDGPFKDMPPIEYWIDFLQELVSREKTNCSDFIPKILGLIARNETFEDTGIPKFEWRNIYLFLNNLFLGLITPDSLSDVESLIVLDVMHAMGDTLRASDVTKQKEMLSKKYQLLNLDIESNFNDERFQVVMCAMKAFANAADEDFSDLFISRPGTLLRTSRTSSLAGPYTSRTSARAETNSDSSRPETSVNPDSLTSTPRVPSAWSPGHNILPPVTDDSLHSHEPTSSASTTTAATESVSLRVEPVECSEESNPTPSTSKTSEEYDSLPGSSKTSAAEDRSRQEFPLKDVSDVDPRLDVCLRHIDRFTKTFVKPKLYSMNPLCIPSDLITFEEKGAV